MKKKKIKDAELDEKNFSKELIDAFILASKSGWADKEYALYEIEEKKMLNGSTDKHDSDRLIIALARIRLRRQDAKKEKTEARKNKKLARSECPLPESGSDEEQEERQENAETLETEG